MLYVLMMEEREYMRDLAMAQLTIDKDTGFKRFQEYQKKMFPWTETAKNREKDIHKQVLLEEMKRGPLSIKPMGSGRAKSRLIKKATDANMNSADINNLYKKLGRSVPI